jgi:hypothetical protein
MCVYVYVYGHHRFVFKIKVLKQLSGRTIIDERQVFYYDRNNIGSVSSRNAA